MMRNFSVWAPRAKSVSVVVDAESYKMEPDGSSRGWWSASVESARNGSRYAFLVEGDPLRLPDPRSPAQPDGVHAASQVYDHSLFPWSDASWQAPPLPSAIVYELHVGTFAPEGTFDSLIPRLEYLRSLGITHIELMPVASFPGKVGWGYDGASLFAPNAAYGGPDALKRLVDACHKSGLAVLLDVVYNHFGPSGNYTGKFGPYLTDSHSTPWGGAVNFEEGGSHEVRRFFCDNALMWMCDYHFDGLRLDAVHAFVDRSATHFLEQLSAETAALSRELGRPLVLIAESDLNDPRLVTPRIDGDASPSEQGIGGYGMDAQWSDDFHHALFAVLSGERQGYYADFGSMEQLATSLTSAYVYEGEFSVYRECHHGRPIGALSLAHFLGYIQNHDQVGNRAIGERLHHLVGLDRAKIAAALVLLSPFVPMIFQGEEFAASSPFQYFADHDDPELAQAVSEGRRREFAAFGWSPEQVPDPEDPATFERSRIPWTELDDPRDPSHREMLEWHRQLIQLRKRIHPTADGARPLVEFDEAARTLVMTRGRLTVAVNLGADAIEFPAPPGASLVLSSRAAIADSRLLLQTDGVAVFA